MPVDSRHWDLRKVSCHLVLLLEDGFLTRSTLHTGISGVANVGDSGIRLTWRGHDLLGRLTAREAFTSGGAIVEPQRGWCPSASSLVVQGACD